MSAAAIYLHLQATGLQLTLRQAPERDDGRGIRVEGLRNLTHAEQARVRCLITSNRAALIALLISGSPAALAVQQEGRAGNSKRSRKEAT